MLRPQLKEFQALARSATLVPVVKTVMADLLTPVSAFLGISAGEPEAFLLESVEGGERIGRYTFLGVRPYMVLESRGEQITLRKGRAVERSKGKLFDVLAQLLREHRLATLPDLPPFNCGAVGFVAYDAVRQLENEALATALRPAFRAYYTERGYTERGQREFLVEFTLSPFRVLSAPFPCPQQPASSSSAPRSQP